ncbi:hypothetical protein BH09PSE2_BH09PSE2_10970 [soil metagenome]
MHLNVVPILGATALSYVLGSLWYLMLGKMWRATVGWAETTPPYRPKPLELVVALVGQLVMAIALDGIVTYLGAGGVRGGLLAAGLVWGGFILPTLATNVVFQRRNPGLIWQDGLHWLVILAAQGVVIGWLG